MGYTQYWTPRVASPEEWEKLVERAKKLKDNLPKYSESAGGGFGEDAGRWKRVIKIRGGLGVGKPSFNKKLIWFNGDEKRGLDHETFSIEPKPTGWNFCKTARKPYDLLVCAILIAAHDIVGYEVSSDGDFNDWKPAIKFYMDTVYGEMLDEDQMRTILPEFLFEEQGGNEYRKPYNLMEELNTMYVIES